MPDTEGINEVLLALVATGPTQEQGKTKKNRDNKIQAVEKSEYREGVLYSYLEMCLASLSEVPSGK